jgi:hypothetical protein
MQVDVVRQGRYLALDGSITEADRRRQGRYSTIRYDKGGRHDHLLPLPGPAPLSRGGQPESRLACSLNNFVQAWIPEK